MTQIQIDGKGEPILGKHWGDPVEDEGLNIVAPPGENLIVVAVPMTDSKFVLVWLEGSEIRTPSRSFDGMTRIIVEGMYPMTSGWINKDTVPNEGEDHLYARDDSIEVEKEEDRVIAYLPIAFINSDDEEDWGSIELLFEDRKVYLIVPWNTKEVIVRNNVAQ